MQVMVINVDLQADADLVLEERRVTGDFKLTRLDMTVHRSTLRQLNPKNVEQLSPVARQILAPELQKILKDGIPIPLQNLVNLYNQELVADQGNALVSADLELNEAVLQKEVEKKLDGSLLGGSLV